MLGNCRYSNVQCANRSGKHVQYSFEVVGVKIDRAFGADKKETYQGQQIVTLHILLVPIIFCANISFNSVTKKRDERILGTGT